MASLFSRRSKANAFRPVAKGSQKINPNLVLWLVPFFLVFLSGLLIASTQRNSSLADWYQHWITAGIGMLFALGLAKLSVERLKPLLLPIYLITVLSLFAVRWIGVSALGSQRWLNIGGLNFQPSELAKLSAILLLAAVLERYPIRRPIDLLRPLGVIALPWALVFFQPDLGTSLVFGALLITMLYWSGMPLEWVTLIFSGLITASLSGLAPGLLIIWIPFIGFVAYRSLPLRWRSALFTLIFQVMIALSTPWIWMNGLKAYQRDRLVLFLDPSKDPLGGGYHLLQSTVGIGSGGLFGAGLLQGQLTKLRFIPEQHTDFIFSAVGEETGFVGSLLVVFAFAIFIFQLLKVARKARTDFESLVVVGIGTMLMFQVVVNIFMTIGLGPVTGIPLPFMSYGRSALMVNFVALGLCISVARRASYVPEKL